MKKAYAVALVLSGSETGRVRIMAGWQIAESEADAISAQVKLAAQAGETWGEVDPVATEIPIDYVAGRLKQENGGYDSTP